MGGRTDACLMWALAALLLAGGATDTLAQKASAADPHEGEYEQLVFNALGKVEKARLRETYGAQTPTD